MAPGFRMRNATGDPYLVKSVAQASAVLEAFHAPGELLRLRDVVARTGLQKATAFRLLYTLNRLGFLVREDDTFFRLEIGRPRKKKHLIGYAMNRQDAGFTRIVTESLRRAAEAAGFEMLVLDNRRDPRATLHNAEVLIKHQVQLAIEFQGIDSISHVLSTTFLEAGIPFIAIDVPHPGGTYYGANNYQAGLLAGRYMAKWVRAHWQGEVDQILLIDYRQAGLLPDARLKGMLTELRAALPPASLKSIVSIDGNGEFGEALDAVRRHVRHLPPQRVLVGAVNDPSALAALRAFEEAGRSVSCAVMGQNAEPDARAELRRPHTRLIGSVAYFPENYGEGIVRLATQILERGNPPPAVFVKHHLITAENVDHFYPNDALLTTLSR